MTNDKLKGRDLDRAVALTIMGWRIEVRTRKSVTTGETVFHWQIENAKGFWWDLEQTERESAKASASWWCDAVGLPHYSTTYAEAKHVLARLVEMGWTETSPVGGDWHELHLSDGKRQLDFKIASQKDLPATICNAALAAAEMIKTK